MPPDFQFFALHLAILAFLVVTEGGMAHWSSFVLWFDLFMFSLMFGFGEVVLDNALKQIVKKYVKSLNVCVFVAMSSQVNSATLVFTTGAGDYQTHNKKNLPSSLLFFENESFLRKHTLKKH